MRGAVNEVARIVKDRSNQSLRVQALPYPVPPSRVWLASVIFYLQLAMVALILLSDSLAPRLGLPGLESKLYPIVGIWFVGNMIQGAMTKTGAFEIWKGSTLIWSTLNAGRMPSMDDLINAFRAVGVQL